MVVPTTEFNVVYLLLHIYRHLLDEGVGMRQLLDYFFALKALSSSQKEKCYGIICSLGMKRLASAVMWIMQEKFGLDADYLLCSHNAREGKMLLNEVMIGGNFGHQDERVSHEHKNALGRGWRNFKKNMRFVTQYPSEVLWAPFWKVWHWFWRKNIKDK